MTQNAPILCQIIWIDFFPLHNQACFSARVKKCSINLQTDAKSYPGCSLCPGFTACFVPLLKTSSALKSTHLIFFIRPFLYLSGCFPAITVNESKHLITKGISYQEQTKAKACSASPITQTMIRVT